MSALANKARAAFKARKSRVLHVPEWGLDLHIFPMTLGQLGRIKEEADELKRMVRILLVRARNEDGTPIFDADDAEALIAEGVDDYGPDVIIRVVTEMGAGDFTDEAQAEKN